MVKILEELNTRKPEYLKYLDEHISNVVKTWNIQLKLILIEEKVDQSIISKIDLQVINHDKSKYDEEEFNVYLNYFYPEGKNKKDEKAFDVAWLRHQNKNPHHWNYWVLRKDSGDVYPLDMPLEYVIEMLCDWQSMSYKYGDSAYIWYNKNKEKMTLSDNTKKLIDKYIKHLKELV